MKNILIAILILFGLLQPIESKSNIDTKFIGLVSNKNINIYSFRENSAFMDNIIHSKVRSQCLDNYLNFVTALDNANNMALQNCRQTFANDVDGWIECNQFAMDVYLGMHAVADAAYDRCMN